MEDSVDTMATSMELEDRSLDDLSGAKIGNYEVLYYLDSSSFNVLWLAKHLETDQLVALNILRQSSNRQKQQIQEDKWNKTTKLHSLLYHPHIAQVVDSTSLLGYQISVIDYGAAVQDLKKYMDDKEFMDESECRGLFRQILSAVAYMHKNHVCHGGLSLCTIRVENERLFLTGFEFAQPFGLQSEFTKQVGYMIFMAPELAQKQPYKGEKVDIWALGVILYHMLCGEAPFTGTTKEEVIEQISSKEISLPPYLTEEAVDIVKQMLARDPRDRIQMDALLDHPWLAIDCDKAIDIHLPSRPDMVPEPDMEIVSAMSKYGFDSASTVKALASKEYQGPAKPAYHLIKEKLEREQDQPVPSSTAESNNDDEERPLIEL
ncbi:MAP/microtubule affinity-regulating kinase 4 [Coemansia sp. RSA 2336]|nr:MAP/microtubule affinity-regulating kinase 4 [Coemansia sp. RSA 2336]